MQMALMWGPSALATAIILILSYKNEKLSELILPIEVWVQAIMVVLINLNYIIEINSMHRHYMVMIIYVNYFLFT